MADVIFSNYKVVLVEPLYSGNVGSVARILSNFACKNIVLVAPQCDFQDKTAKQFACKLSQDVLATMKVVPTLTEAIADCVNVVGFSRRSENQKHVVIEIENLPPLFSKGKTALVFGREDNGLTCEEILSCTHIATIPTAETCPSLNLSHAVAIVLAEIFKQKQKFIRSNLPQEETLLQKEIPISQDDFQKIMQNMRELLINIDLNRAGNPERMLPHIQRLFQRSEMSEREGNLLRGILERIQKRLPAKNH